MRQFAGRLFVGMVSRLPRPMARLLRTIPGAPRLHAALRGRPLGRAPRAGGLRPVVCLPTWSRWGVMKQRPHYLMEGLARAGHPVYFVDPGVTKPTWADGVRLVPAIADVPARHVILYVHFAPLIAMVAEFEDPVVIYDIYDDLSIFRADEDEVPEPRRVATHHKPMIESATAVLVSDATLAAHHRRERPDLLIIENGVDLAMFADTDPPRPADFPPTTGPVIGYHGMMSHWFDFELLVGVARRKPEWTFVLVGPIDPRVASAAGALIGDANILLLGEKPSARIAAYVHQFDVGAIWFKVNELTRSVNPLKMYECMAAGVPVVAPPLPACLVTPGVRVADGIDDFTARLEEALAAAAGEAATLRETARMYSWQQRITPLIDWLDRHDLRTVPG